jgi:predicted dehydrogenase
MKTVGIVGCGNISGIYFKNLCSVFENIRVKYCADLDPERTQAKVAEYPSVEVSTLETMLADKEIDIILNLTKPQGHYHVAKQVLEVGKSVYNEKPLTLTRKEGLELLELAGKHGVEVGAAPDTFLGAGIQTCLRLINEGAIGEPIGAQAFMHGHGHEHWHPDPDFYYKKGAGPMFDMGPYYITALVALLGPVRRATGSARISFPTRTITSEKKWGQTIEVEIPTHIAGVLDFVAGSVGTISTSFDIWASEVPRIEIFGSEGTLSVPDPNRFGGPIKIRKPRAEEWEDVPVSGAYAENSRGIGVADMAAGLEEGRPNRANGELAYHVLDIMHAIHDASSQERHVHLESTCAKPQPLPQNQTVGQVV